MMTDVLRSINGLEIFPVIGLFIFMIAFGMVIWWIVRLDKRLVKEMADIPLDRRTDSEGEDNHE